ncbi:GntR family transcriptional regulator [Sinosporangium siamense]|uniref:GntR family transcriptional regulator n=1 Tax=Sinosporangium siamense TaxID=1367973 RepID=A0A919V673_9ACTN|nr:GntR family transcriptional regulator [Sinosporangium siamense]GII90647.1 GntR family transcriptional regulator [Sinosporangium siamense]
MPGETTNSTAGRTVPGTGEKTAVAGAHRRLLEMISSGELQPGERLGAERELSLDLGVSRATLRQALVLLEQTGAVRRVPGRGGGTFVSRPKIERDLSRVVGIPAMLREQGFTAGSRVVSASITGADQTTATALSLQAGDLVTEIVRIRLADGHPISLENARFPALRFPGLLDMHLGGSIYELLSEVYGVRPGDATERIEAIPAGPTEAAVLDIAENAPLLAITRTTRDPGGVAFEFSHDLFRADRTRILVHTTGVNRVTDSARTQGRPVDLDR